MSQHYSDPERENDKWSLPDVEVFYANEGDNEDIGGPEGWYYWFCFPGCMPEGPANGPYDTEQLALEAARDSAAD